MPESFAPQSIEELVAIINWANSGVHPLEVLGGGSKRVLGRPVQSEMTLSLSSFDGISEYQPEELVLTAGAATPLTEIESVLLNNKQMLAFEPMKFGTLLSTDNSETIGGVLASNLSGPRRIKAGAARDHLLGFHAVSGRGEAIKSGGKVVKNVTGYDLSKLMVGSWGTLAVIHQVSLKVLPAPESVRTVIVFGLSEQQAIEVLGKAMASPHDVSGAAHVPENLSGSFNNSYVTKSGDSVTAVRLEGIKSSVEFRCQELLSTFSILGKVEELHSHNSLQFWADIRDVIPYSRCNRAIWRVSVPPSSGARMVADLREHLVVDAYYDWAGGLVWLALEVGEEAGANIIHKAVIEHGGHSTLIRAPVNIRSSVSVFKPQTPTMLKLTARLKESFDKVGILNPGRMYPGI